MLIEISLMSAETMIVVTKKLTLRIMSKGDSASAIPIKTPAQSNQIMYNWFYLLSCVL